MKKYSLQFKTSTLVSILRAATFAALTAALLAASVNNSNAQTVTVDEHGNFHAKPREVALRDSTTGKTFTDVKGQVHTLYKGAKGSLYYCRVSKNGNFYRKYIKTEEMTFGK